MLTFGFEAANEWIPSKTGSTAADGFMIDNLALSPWPANAWARIRTCLVHACSVERAFRADHALRSAGRRSAIIRWLACANGVVVNHAASAEGPAWTGHAWFTRWLRWLNGCKSGLERDRLMKSA